MIIVLDLSLNSQSFTLHVGTPIKEILNES